ncbi:MAG: hypothetical protein ABGX63_02580 [bacterium]
MPQKKRNIRPLKKGEFRQNADGTRSSELNMAVIHPHMNKGKPTNIPSLFVENGKVVQFHSEDEAVSAALATGLKFPSFKSIPDAIKAARARSSAGGTGGGPLGRK